MKKQSDTDLQLKTIKTALIDGLIDPIKAVQLIDDVMFWDRVSDIISWGRYYLEDKFDLPSCNELHYYLAETAQDPFTDTMAPRGHGKTIIRCVLIPIYLALNFPGRYRHFLNIQSTSTKAASINLAIRIEFEQNERIRADYGDQVIPEKWTEKQFVLANGSIFTAIGSGESVRGLNYRNVRPDYVITDDLYDEDAVENPNIVRKINRWFWSSIYKCVATGRNVCFHLIGTAISREDLMHTLAKNSRWKFRKFQAVLDWDAGELLWHENPLNTIEKQRQDKSDMGSIIYEREMQNEVRDDLSAIVKSGWIKFYDGRKILTKSDAENAQKMDALAEIPEYAVSITGGIDPAEKTKEQNDFTAKIGAIKTNLGNHYIFDATNQKLSFHANLEDIKAWGKRFLFSRVKIETNKGEALFTEIKRTTSIPMVGIHETRDKTSRFIGQSAKFENGKVYISMLIPESIRGELVEQITTNNPPHDDMRDALLLAIEETKRELFIG